MKSNTLITGIFRYHDVFKGSAVDMVEMTRSDIYAIQKIRIGEMIAFKEEDSNVVCIGFSACHPTDMKHYNKVEGRHMATKRAEQSHKVKDLDKHVPHLVREDLAYFALRCQNYFKGCFLPWWIEILIEEYVNFDPK